MTESPIDTQEIVRLYVEEELSIREIATRVGRSYGRVYGILRARVVMRTARRSGEYARVAELMRERIVNGDWRPNRKILSQEDLSTIFGVRQQVIREAIADLRRRGYLFTVRHKGTYVRPRQDWESGER